MIFSFIIFLIYDYVKTEKYYKQKYLSEIQNKLLLETEYILDRILHSVSLSREEFQEKFTVNNYTLEVCNKYGNCKKYDLLQAEKIFNNRSYSYVNYEILLNDKLLYTSNRVDNYEYEKYINVNNNQLYIALSVDENYWKVRQRDIQKPYWFIFTTFVLVNIIAFIFYKLYATTNLFVYKQYIGQITKSKERDLEKRIWNVEYTEKKDREINLIFSRYAQFIASDQKENQDIPCTIILTTGQKRKSEKINLYKVKKLFNERFESQEENVDIIISYYKEYIYFNSKILLYQIIYSIFNYIIFIIKFYNVRYSKIILSLGKEDNIINFEIKGKELEKYNFRNINEEFKRQQANPFIIDLYKIKEALAIEKYSIDFTELGKIVISQKRENNHFTKSNVINIDSRRKSEIYKKDIYNNSNNEK